MERTELVNAVAAWMRFPEDERKPRNRTELRQSLNIPTDKFRELWASAKAIVDAEKTVRGIQANMMKSIDPDKLEKAIETSKDESQIEVMKTKIFEMAMGGNVRAAEIWTRFMKVGTEPPKEEKEITADELSGLMFTAFRELGEAKNRVAQM